MVYDDDDDSDREIGHLDWDDYKRGTHTLANLENLAQFGYVARTNLAGRWAQIISADRVAIRIQASVLDALRLAKFHNPNMLDVLLLSDGIRFEYTDAEFGFIWKIDDDGTISLTRRGSSMRRFHDWYRHFMPSASAILRETVAALDDEVSRTTGRGNNVMLQQLNYTFSLVCFDFKRKALKRGEETAEESANTSVHNFDLIKALVSKLPDEGGRLVEAGPLSRDEFNRLDYQVSRASRTKTSSVNEIYRVEAPSNNAWSSLWFTFMYSGGTSIRPDGTRLPFNADDFANPTSNVRAYRDFFRTRAVEGFLADLTTGYRFSSTSGDLP